MTRLLSIVIAIVVIVSRRLGIREVLAPVSFGTQE